MKRNKKKMYITIGILLIVFTGLSSKVCKFFFTPLYAV